jgi:biopolymer transport protein ExbB/TolQ
MVSFCGMAVEGKADINAIAPGVSGALLTTVVGLLVAIPALIGFNLLTSKIKSLTIEMDNASDQLLSVLKVSLVK